MTESHEPIGKLLNDTGWRQGAIADDRARIAVVHVLQRHGCHELAESLGLGTSCAVLISQTCDVVSLVDESEPFVEFAVATIQDGKPDPADTFLKSFRKFAVPLMNVQQHLLLRPWDRVQVPRGALVGTRPSQDLTLDWRSCQDLMDWLATRYTRSALPDEFNRRLKVAGAEEAIRKTLARAPRVTEIYLLLRPRSIEIANLDESYSIDVVLLCERDVYLDQGARLAIQTVVDEIEGIFVNVGGLEIEGVKLRGEHEFSRHEMREYDRWQMDDVSYAAEYRAQKKSIDVPAPAYRADVARGRTGSSGNGEKS
ncbi:conserved protein of unknown function (plasmid) [Pararobbsia alpina]|uniref:hypothetical protein n=1 Tax=Pararobbsia alpina TaxID=621374 RepID=UPI0039A5719D